jgi:hypothetical protein
LIWFSVFNHYDMTMAIREICINQQFEKISLTGESKYDDEILDDAVVNAMKSDHKSFCLQVEGFLNNFLLTDNTSDVIVNLDKFQRKIVHKICDIYRVKREYVDVKTNDMGDITISRSEESKIPSMSLESRFSKHVDETKKQAPKIVSNPMANKKMIIKSRDVKKTGSESDSSDGSNENSKGDAKKESDQNEQKKQLDYEKAREKIMQETETSTKTIEKPKKKGLRVDQFYDPDYDRSKATTYNTNQNMGYYPPPYMYYPYQGYQQGQMPIMNGFQPSYGANPMPEDNGFGYQNDFPSLATNGKNFKKK